MFSIYYLEGWFKEEKLDDSTLEGNEKEEIADLTPLEGDEEVKNEKVSKS